MIGRALLLLAVAFEVAATSAVYVAPARVFNSTSPADLRSKCGVESSIHACTTFEQPVLTTHCRKESAWHLDATLQLAPTVLLTRSSFLAHENQHLIDIRERLEKHLATVTAPRFASREQCLQAAGKAIFMFPAVFERVKGDSNLELDGMRDPGHRTVASAE